jgi:hypothetical protein
LSAETKLANLIGLPQFFDQSTVHRYLNRFGKWHVDQLDRVNTQVLAEHGESMRQDIVLLDVDSQTPLRVESAKAQLLARTARSLANLVSSGMWASSGVKQYLSA